MSYTQHVCGPAKLLDSTAQVIDQVEGQAFDLGLQKLVASSAGQIYPTFTAIMAGKPRFSLTTQQIATFLTRIGAEGLVFATGFEVYNQFVDDANGKRGGASTHEKIAIAAGIILPRRLTVSQSAPAKLTFDVIGINAAGTTNPATKTGSVSLPTTAGVAEIFTLGPISINGTVYQGIQELEIDFGLTEEIKMSSGAIYPQRVHLASIRPKVTIRTDDAAILAALTTTGLAQTATDSIIYLRKCAANAIRVADATAQHISFTIDDGLWIAKSKGGDHPNPLSTPIECEPTYDGTNLPLAISAATAIT